MLRRIAFAAFCAFLASTSTLAQERLLTLDDLYHPTKKLDLEGRPPSRLRWLKDNEHFLQRGEGEAAPLLKIRAVSGESRPFYDPARLQEALRTIPGIESAEAARLAKASGWTVSPVETGLLTTYKDDLLFYDIERNQATPLTSGPAQEKEAELSPDDRLVAFVREGNLFVADVARGRERQLTADGGPDVQNGLLDWVYQEEVYGRGAYRAFWWSPDSTRIAFLQVDDSEVPKAPVLNHAQRNPVLEMTRYPKPGDPNPRVRLGVASVTGGGITWVDTARYDGSEFLVVRVSWTPDSQKVVFLVQNREQTWLDLNLFGMKEGKSNLVLRETSPAWVDVLDLPLWLKDGSFIWRSERNGWAHLYRYQPDGKLQGTITSGEWKVDRVHGVDEANQWLWFSGSKDGPIESHVYRVRLDGGGLSRLSQEAGNHSANFNANLSLFLDTWSNAETPSQLRLHQADGAVVRAISVAPPEALKQLKLCKPEFLQVKTADGFLMEAMLIKPPDFNPARKYPVMWFLYGGPGAPTVRNQWLGRNHLWYQLLAHKGYLVWACDNRSASGKGAKSAWTAFRKLGEAELRDLEEGVRWLKSQPFVDGARIGLSGWSYGGYMTSYALTHSKSFKIGIAGAPPTDWGLYDSIYTERYMGLPRDNPQGYEAGSVLKAAANLEGKLLLVHGLIDDNVHVENSIQLMEALQKAGKQFEVMFYPNSRHGVMIPALVYHMRQMMLDFIVRNL
jgi:dipeptidyl-peptidase-4